MKSYSQISTFQGIRRFSNRIHFNFSRFLKVRHAAGKHDIILSGHGTIRPAGLSGLGRHVAVFGGSWHQGRNIKSMAIAPVWKHLPRQWFCQQWLQLTVVIGPLLLQLCFRVWHMYSVYDSQNDLHDTEKGTASGCQQWKDASDVVVGIVGPHKTSAGSASSGWYRYYMLLCSRWLC
jgi:hypothetical protein